MATLPDMLDRPPASARRRRTAIVFTERDVRILRDLFDSRILTARQIADIHFKGSRNAAKQRLWALKRADYIAARFGSTVAEQQPLRLTRSGFEYLRQHGHLDDFPRVTWLTMSKRLKVSNLTLQHEIDVGSVKAAFHRAAREQRQIVVESAITWPRMIRFQARPSHLADAVRVSPDGFLRLTHQIDIGTARRMDFFLEVDRSTETISRIVERMQGYVAYYTTGGYAKRQGGSDARLFPFRVCWTFRTKSRMSHFLCACREHAHPVLKMAWAATHEEASANPLSAIWQRPIDKPDQRQGILPTQP